MSDPVFIDDGYTIDGYVKEDKGIHGAVGFMFRPALPSERAKVLGGWKSPKGDDKPKPADDESNIGLQADAIVAHLASWDVVNSKGEPVTLNKENVRRLHPSILTKLFYRVLGMDRRDDRESDEAADVKN